MKVDKRLYPHPVLSYYSDDIINSNFKLITSIDTTSDKYVFKVEAKLNNTDIRDLIDNKKAAYAIHIECPTSGFRKMIKSFDPSFNEYISSEYLEGRVEVCSFVIANDVIPQYRNKNFNSDYSNISFVVKKGDVLCIDQDFSFDAVKDTDPLKRISSIFKVKEHRDPKEKTPMTLDLEGEYITINLTKDNFRSYINLRLNRDLEATLASMIIFPALTYVIEYLKGMNGNFDDSYGKKWFRAISRKMKELGYNIEDDEAWSVHPITLSQQLIGDSLTTALKVMNDMQDIEE